MKILRHLFLLLTVLVLALSLAACAAPTPPDVPPVTEDGEGESITGVTFESLTVDYDGEPHTITVGGTLPDGVSVEYTNNTATDAGSYSATAVLTGEGYKTKTMTATLTINKLNFTGLTLTGASHDYDNAAHSLVVSGDVPSGATVTYTGGEDGANGAINAGSYTIKAKITKKNYNDLTLTATLTINKINFGSLEFKGETVNYDEKYHKLTISGFIPADATVTYAGGEDGKNGAKNPGTYTITVTVQHKNYNTFSVSAELVIKSEEKPLSVTVIGNKVYFQNALDREYLYTIERGEITRVSTDSASDMMSVGNSVFYISKAFGTSISYIGEDMMAKQLLDANANAITTDGTYIYYSSYSVFNKDINGIWKVAIADLLNSSVDATATRLTEGGAECATYVDGAIYYSNKSDGGKLYAVSANGGASRLVYGYKVSEMITDGESLYFVRTSLGSAIYGIDVKGGLMSEVTDSSERVVKITTSNGKNLTKIGDYVYFINTDYLTSTLFGDGIYRAKADGTEWVEDVESLLNSTAKVISYENDQVFSLASDGESLYYYRTSTRHLYAYSLADNTEVDLMEGYVPPEYKPTIITMHSKSAYFDGSIYYVNMLDGGKLYRYDVKSGAEYKITSAEVADFIIADGYLYYTTVKLVLNLDLYRLDLVSGETTLLSKDNCVGYVRIDNKLYYTNDTDKTLEAIDIETLEIEVVYSEKSVKPYRMQYYGGKLYFVADKYLYAYDFASKTASIVNKKLEPLEFIIHNDVILMMNQEGILKDYACAYDMKTDTVINLADLGLSNFSSDIRGTFVYKNEIYFYRNIAAGTDTLYGMYKLVKDGTTYKQELVNTFDGYYICEPTVVGDSLYFIDVWRVKDSVPTPESDAHLYRLDLTTLANENPTITRVN